MGTLVTIGAELYKTEPTTMVSLSSSDSLPYTGPGSFFSALILLCPDIGVQPRSCGGRDLRAEVLLITSLGLLLLLLWWG